MAVRSLLVVLISLSSTAACGGGGDGETGASTTETETGAGTTDSTSSAGSSTTGSGSDSAATTGETDTSSGTDTSTGTSSSGTATGTDTGAGPSGCPDPLPADWIFCEDFEDLADPSTRFFEYNDGSGNFVRVDDEGASGTHSMRATYHAGEAERGWISVAFGRNPIVYGGNPHVRPDEDFDEIYWRLRLKMEAGWPDVGPAKVTRATAFAKDNWGQAMIAHLWSAGDGVTLQGDPATCVTESTVDCNQYNDFGALQWLGQMNGTTPLFSSGLSGSWHCIEGHVTLNNPGQADGVFEFWIDGQLENARADLDWRGSWTEYGLNLVSFENYWNGGPPRQLDRWMDDVAIATVPIGCD